MNGICSEQWVIEADGDVYPCDFYVLDEWRLGNIRENSFEEMNRKREELQFVALSRHTPQECRSCRWYPLCRNGCRRDRTLLSDGRTPGLNAYCSAYQDFFCLCVSQACGNGQSGDAGREVSGRKSGWSYFCFFMHVLHACCTESGYCLQNFFPADPGGVTVFTLIV